MKAQRPRGPAGVQRARSPVRARAAAALTALLLAGCAGGPPLPDWQLSARGALDRATRAYLQGDGRVAEVEFERARSELSRTGRPALLARAELARCAAQAASLQFEPCARFAPLRADAPAAERAYADYLTGAAVDAALLPAAQRAVAAAGDGAAAEAALRQVDDPLSRLVAAGVLAQRGLASPAVAALAADTAAGQGWRRPLLAWLQVQLAAAEKAGASADAERLKRRIAIAGGTPRR